MCVLWGLHVLEREGMGVDELCEMFSALFAGKLYCWTVVRSKAGWVMLWRCAQVKSVA